jgi:hypothetical protein
LSELRRVKYVERLGAKLHFHLLLNREILEQRHIEIDSARSEQNIAPGVGVSEGRRSGECGIVEPAVDRALTGRQRAVGGAIGPAGAAVRGRCL